MQYVFVIVVVVIYGVISVLSNDQFRNCLLPILFIVLSKKIIDKFFRCIEFMNVVNISNCLAVPAKLAITSCTYVYQ